MVSFSLCLIALSTCLACGFCTGVVEGNVAVRESSKLKTRRVRMCASVLCISYYVRAALVLILHSERSVFKNRDLELCFARHVSSKE